MTQDGVAGATPAAGAGGGPPFAETHTYIKHRDRAIIVDKFSRIVFPLSFFIINSCYWAVYLDWN